MAADRGHVLFAEDNQDFREIVSDGLRAEGFRVSAFSDGAAALQAILATPPPFVVVTDLLMPGVSGYELIAELGARGLASSIPTVVLSAVSDPDVPRGILVLEKPVDVSSLAKALIVQARLAERHQESARKALQRNQRKAAKRR